MTTPASGWSSRQWMGLTALLAVLHAGGFWLIAHFPPGPSLDDGDTFGLVWSAGFPDSLDVLVLSPTRFALPDAGGFSGDAAGALPPVAYGWGRTEPRPSFLPADPSGSNLGPAPATPSPPSRILSLPVVTPARSDLARMTQNEAQVEIRGALTTRSLMRPLKIAPWTESDSPQTTHVELAVNPWGEVLTARITVGSGSKAADLATLEAVRNARFQPLTQPKRPDALHVDPLTWGVVSVHPIPGAAPKGPGTPL